VKTVGVTVNTAGTPCCSTLLVLILLKTVKFKLSLKMGKNRVCLCCWTQFMYTLLTGHMCVS